MNESERKIKELRNLIETQQIQNYQEKSDYQNKIKNMIINHKKHRIKWVKLYNEFN